MDGKLMWTLCRCRDDEERELMWSPGKSLRIDSMHNLLISLLDLSIYFTLRRLNTLLGSPWCSYFLFFILFHVSGKVNKEKSSRKIVKRFPSSSLRRKEEWIAQAKRWYEEMENPCNKDILWLYESALFCCCTWTQTPPHLIKLVETTRKSFCWWRISIVKGEVEWFHFSIGFYFILIEKLHLR